MGSPAKCFGAIIHTRAKIGNRQTVTWFLCTLSELFYTVLLFNEPLYIGLLHFCIGQVSVYLSRSVGFASVLGLILWLLQNLRPPVRWSPFGHRPNVSSVLMVCPGVFLRFITSLKHRKLLETSSIGSGKLSSRKVWTRCSYFSWLL